MLTFEEIIKKPQHALKKALISELNRMGYRTITKKGFTYAKGSLPVMLVAHLDTVHREPVRAICYSIDASIMMSPQGIGGDDRAGVYMILQIIQNHRCHVLFCEDEEIGGVGAHEFIKSRIRPEISYIVELDRRGSDDAVFYDCDNPEFTEFVCGFGFNEDFGSFSDISIIAPELGVAAVNVSAGYYNEHTKHEYIDMDAVNNNVERVGKMVATPAARFNYMEALRFSQRGLFDGHYLLRCDDWESGTEEPASIRQLKRVAEQFGIFDDEVDLLFDFGYDPDEIEMLLHYPQELRRAINELMFEEINCE